MKNSAEYDFLQEVFEWVFYNMPIQKDNSYIRNIYEFYQNNGGLSGKQIQVLLNEIEKIEVKPPFNPATLEAIIKKKAVKYRSKLPPVTPMYTEDSESKDKLQQILAIAPQHKAAIAYMNKVNLNQALTPVEKEDINKFLKLLKK
ncbi:MAG TPA: hypothetical protein VK625_23345 [Flavitalea sp.]|nr:hypothetical protein [Flavitalea sp.]